MVGLEGVRTISVIYNERGGDTHTVGVKGLIVPVNGVHFFINKWKKREREKMTSERRQRNKTRKKCLTEVWW